MKKLAQGFNTATFHCLTIPTAECLNPLLTMCPACSCKHLARSILLWPMGSFDGQHVLVVPTFKMSDSVKLLLIITKPD